jgi:hypothetical protein
VSPESVPVTAANREKIVGVTTRDGESLEFDDPGAHLKSDSLYARIGGDYVVVAMEDADRVIVERREGNTVATVALVAGITLGLLIVAAAATPEPEPRPVEESCPFVYSWDGEAYVLDAEPFGGAITSGLERDDYSPLEHLTADAGEYRLRITNEVYETQHTNLMELWVVDHEPGTLVAADTEGNLYSVEGRHPPLAARDGAGRDLLVWLEATDRLVWEPMAVPDAEGDLYQDIVLTFPRNPKAPRARLVVNAATGLWGSHMIREFVQLRGSDGTVAWFDRLDADPGALAELHTWNLREQLYVLRIYVEESTGWEMRGELRGEGPLIAHDRVGPLDISRATGEMVRIRIEPPRGFWALNSFGVTYDTGPSLPVTRVAPRQARSADGTDLLPLLSSTDNLYYDMPLTGDWGDVSFAAPLPVAGKERSVILHSRGYYELHLDPDAEADTTLVRRIEEVPGAGAAFAADQYGRWSTTERLRRVEATAVGGAGN